MTAFPAPEAATEASDLATWNTVVGQAFGEIAVDAPAGGFRAGLRHRSWGGLAVSMVDSTPAHVEGCLRPGASPGDAGGCFLLLGVLGHTTVSQCGHDALLGPGDLTVVCQGEPYCIEFSEAHRMQVLAVPKLDGRSALDAHVARCHASCEAPLLGGFMAQLAAIDDACAPVLDGQAGVHLALDLLALSWPRPRDDESTDRRALAVWAPRVLERIERELCDPGLDAQALGHALGISARYVQMVFAQRGSTVTAHLQERRLQRAAQRLREPGAASISEVALDVGFSDLSHFCRCFRRRFGCTAREWRLRG